MRKSFTKTILSLLFMVVSVIYAQQTVSGVVTDQDGIPLPGVNIAIKGADNGTTTDLDGNYSIQAENGSVLVFSFVGYADVEKTVNGSTMNVTFEDSETLGTAVIVGALGVERVEKSVGYAVQNVDAADISVAPEANLVNSLSGRVSGVQITNSSGNVGSSSRIILRGVTSITGNNQPLFVLDGIPIDNTTYGNAGGGGGVDLPNGVADLNPDDIESYSVLKGPNAAALYGVRASNGVILITTKSGKNSGGKVSVSVSSRTSFQDILVSPNFQNSYGQGANQNYFEFKPGTSGDDEVDESWGPPLDVGLEFVQFDSYKNDGQPTPWVSHPSNYEDFFKTGSIKDHNFSIMKGGDGYSMRISASHSEQDGIVPFTDFRKNSFSVNASAELSDRLTLGVVGNYFINSSDNITIGGYNNENPVQQMIWFGRQVDFNALKDWRNLPLADASTAAGGTPLNWNTRYQNNPYWVLENNTNTFDKNRLIGKFNLDYKINDEFKINGFLGMDNYSQFETRRQMVGSNNAPNGSYTEINRNFTEVNAQILLSYTKDFTEDFKLNLNVGGNKMYRKYNRIYTDLPALELPDLFTLSNIKSGNTAVTSSLISKQRINSVLGFGQISFKNAIFVDFTARNDWASVLPEQNNSFFYPSVSTSIVASDLIDLGESINFLKLRGGWAKVGSNGALDPYNVSKTFNFGTSFGSTPTLTSPNTLFNPTLVNETTTSIELGTELRMFENRLRLDFSYYDMESDDLLVPADVSRASGNSRAWNNIAKMSNKGFELMLGVTAVKKEDLQVDFDFNFAKNKNTVEEIKGLDTYIIGGQWGMTLEAQEGQPYGLINGPGFDRNDNGDIIYVNGVPQTTTDSKVLGNIQPDWTGGLKTSIRYKNLNFTALLDAKIGGDIHSMTYTWGRYAGVLEETLKGRETGIVGDGVMNVGTAENPEWVANNVAVSSKLFNQSVYSNANVESAVFDASYVKLRQMALTYTLPTRFLDSVFLNNVSFSVFGNNLAILYKNAPHIDPESAFSSSEAEQGQEFGQIPSTRTIGFGVNLKF